MRKHFVFCVFFLFFGCGNGTKSVISSQDSSVDHDLSGSVECKDWNSHDVAIADSDSHFQPDRAEVEDEDQLTERDNYTDFVNSDHSDVQEIYPDVQDLDRQDSDLNDFDQAIESDQTDSDQANDQQVNEDLTYVDEIAVDESPLPDQSGGDEGLVENEAWAHVSSWPQGAEATITGEGIEHVENTPFDVLLPYGLYEITMTYPGYFDYVGNFSVPEETEISVILEEALVEVTFTSNPPEVEVCLDVPSCNPFITEFTQEFAINSSHDLYASKEGYQGSNFTFEVGSEPMEVNIQLVPLDYEYFCSWISGEFEVIESSTGENYSNVTVTSDIYEDHCEVWGLEPPAPTGQWLKGEYIDLIEMFRLECPGPDMCAYIVCEVFVDLQIIDCIYKDSDYIFNQNIVWHKVP